MTQSLSLVFGTEAFVVLKDIWGLDRDDAQEVAIWAALALVRAAKAEATNGARKRPPIRKNATKTTTRKTARKGGLTDLATPAPECNFKNK